MNYPGQNVLNGIEGSGLLVVHKTPRPFQVGIVQDRTRDEQPALQFHALARLMQCSAGIGRFDDHGGIANRRHNTVPDRKIGFEDGRAVWKR